MVALKAYIEIRVEPGNDVEKIVENIKRAEGVKEVCRVIGRVDVVVTVEGRDLKHLSDITLERISAVRGVSIGQTLVCVETETPTQSLVPSTSSEEVPAISFS